jgi:dihydrofolate reductase
MRKLVTDHLLSLDGYCGGIHDEIDWFRFDEESQEWSRNLLRAAGAIVLGRRTYDLFMQYWPTPEAMKNEPVITERLAALPKIIFSRTVESSTWSHCQFTRRPPVEVVRELKQQDGGPILVIGSASILAAVWNERLVDELHLRIQPIVLGQGKPLFPNTETRQTLELKESHRYQSGVSAVRYEVVRA